MEQSNAFKEAVETIKAMELQLSLCNSYTSKWENSVVEAEKQIEDYFEKVTNALAARKTALEKEIAKLNASRKLVLQEQHKKLEVSIEGCKATMKGAAVLHTVNPSAYETILKSIKLTSVANIDESIVQVDLAASIFEHIQDIGNVQEHFTTNIEGSSIFSNIKGISSGDSAIFGSEIWQQVKHEKPISVCLNTYDNNLYICNSDKIQTMTPQGLVSTFATIKRPSYITFNALTKFFFVGSYVEKVIYKVSPQGEVSVLAGTANKRGNNDALGPKASFESPAGLAIDKRSGDLYVSDFRSHRIRKISPIGEVTTIVGGFFGSPLRHPWGMCLDEQNNSLILCDYGNHCLKRVQFDGKVSTLCSVDSPTDVAISSNDIYVISQTTKQLYKLTQTQEGTWTTTILAGEYTSRHFKNPVGIAIDSASRTCYVADEVKDQIHKIPL